MAGQLERARSRVEPHDRLVAFDMDDTLYSEVQYVRSGYRAVASHIARLAGLSADDLFDRMWWHFQCGDRRKVFDAVLADFSLQSRFRVSDLVDLYRAHRPAIRLAQDAEEVLTTLRDRGLRLAVVSDGPLEQQKRKAEALRLAERVDAIVFTDALPPGSAKPSPAAFAQLMKDFGIAPQQCLYVADNPAKDFVGPNVLGWLTVQIVRERGIYRAESPPPGGEPHRRIHDLRELLPLLSISR